MSTSESVTNLDSFLENMNLILFTSCVSIWSVKAPLLIPNWRGDLVVYDFFQDFAKDR